MAPKGIYLWGPVGRGKSMLMDLFFAAAPLAHKRRVHFHGFMLDVHDRIERERRARTSEPVPRVAADLAAEATLLCFDEFQVNDIADAMILERLFRALFDAGTVVVATSNRHPDRLYENGLQRDRFLPFIALLQERLDIVALDSGRDYRLARMIGQPTLFPSARRGVAPGPRRRLRRADRGFAGRRGNADRDEAEAACAALRRRRRLVHLRRALRPAAIGGRLPGAGRALRRCPGRGHPAVGPQQRNEAQRFHILIDTLYEARALFLASAAVPPQEIYTEGDGSFEFQRTVSRLMEMQSEDYIANRALSEELAP